MSRSGSAVEMEDPRNKMENIPKAVVSRTLLWSRIIDFRLSQNCRGEGAKG